MPDTVQANPIAAITAARSDRTTNNIPEAGLEFDALLSDEQDQSYLEDNTTLYLSNMSIDADPDQIGTAENTEAELDASEIAIIISDNKQQWPSFAQPLHQGLTTIPAAEIDHRLQSVKHVHKSQRSEPTGQGPNSIKAAATLVREDAALAAEASTIAARIGRPDGRADRPTVRRADQNVEGLITANSLNDKVRAGLDEIDPSLTSAARFLAGQESVRAERPIDETELALVRNGGDHQILRSTPNVTAPGSAEVARHVSGQLAAAVSHSKSGVTEVTLNPQELGRVRLTMTAQDNAVALTIFAERPETTELIRRHIDQLAHDFKALGYHDITFSFDQKNPDEGHNYPQKKMQSNEPTLLNIDAELVPEIMTLHSRGRLDLRL